MSTVRVRFIARLTLVGACSVAVFALGACGTSAGMPHFKVSATVGPQPHRATINVIASGSGEAMADVVLTYPNGSKHELVSAHYRDGGSTHFFSEGLPKGKYTYTVWAIPGGANYTTFPTSGRVDQNIVASPSFVMP
jgi:hypothetical protein